jgi:nucleotide-binding universal stress UspA family protein
MRILIAIDGSDSSDAVIQQASARPWPGGSTFTLLSALDPFFFNQVPQLLEEAKKNTTQMLDEAAQPLRDAGWSVQISTVLDTPRHGISLAATDSKADLIMLGSHGKGTFRRLLLGSTAQAVLRHATCSVEIVRHPSGEDSVAHRAMKILLPTDASEYAEKAVKAVAGRGWSEGTTVKIISVPELPVLVGEFPYYDPEQWKDMANKMEAQARENVKNAGTALEKTGVQIETEVTDPKDSPAGAIVEAADDWRADLIVMGSHGRRGLDRIVLGSVSESVALHAHCSVEVVR